MKSFSGRSRFLLTGDLCIEVRLTMQDCYMQSVTEVYLENAALEAAEGRWKKPHGG